MTRPDYSAWHYAPDALVRVTPGAQATLDVHLMAGFWSRTPTQETVSVRWSVAGGREAVVPAADVIAVDDALAARLAAIDDAPVTGPRPLAVAPYPAPGADRRVQVRATASDFSYTINQRA